MVKYYFTKKVKRTFYFCLMKIVLLSDTHSYLDEAILKICRSADEIWHAGDIGREEVADQLAAVAPLKAVYGNIDDTGIRARFPKEVHLERNGLRIWMTHIGGYPPRYSPAIVKGLQQHRPDVFICGHSHILKVMRDKQRNVLHINPGAVGKHGFHQKRTMLRFNIKAEQLQDLELVEWER